MYTFQFSQLFARQNAPATKIFILINLVFYILTCTHNEFYLQKLVEGPTFSSLITFGAKENGLIAIGEIYRFFFQFFYTLT